MTVACVLRSGGVYGPPWVQRLRDGVSRHLSGHRFVCLSDMPVLGVETLPLHQGWPGWWAKMALFEPGIFTGPVLYMDLDTVVTGDLSDLASYRGALALLSDFYRPGRAQSGVMLWTPGPVTAAVWEAWMRDPAGHMRRFRGDGQWLHAHTTAERIQQLYPGQVVSFKVHCRGGVPADARLVCFHGAPKQADLQPAHMLRQAWGDVA